MRVVVSGSAGFIGRHVVKALQEAGHYVIGLDVAQSPGDEWRAADITYPLPGIADLDAVIHLAAVSHPTACDKNPGMALNVNVNGTHQVLKMALESGAKKVVFSSSAHVYGISPKYLPTDENHPLWLQNTYTYTKILGEELCRLYFENHGLGYTTLRLFNAYGDGQGLGFFVPDMLVKARSGEINLPGGNTTKDWVYVEDVARAFVLALESDFVGPINIGTGIETSLVRIADRIADQAGAVLVAHAIDNATRMCADIGRAARVLGWKPTISVEEGLDAILGIAKATA